MIDPLDRNTIMEVAAEYLKETLEKTDSFEAPDICRKFLQFELDQEKSEVFCVLFLDTRHRLIKFERIFNGTIDGATVYPRVIAAKALEYNAAALILAHNHPSGMAKPSLADEAITRRIKTAMALFDIRVLDHFIIGDNEIISMAEKGKM